MLILHSDIFSSVHWSVPRNSPIIGLINEGVFVCIVNHYFWDSSLTVVRLLVYVGICRPKDRKLRKISVENREFESHAPSSEMLEKLWVA